MKTYLDVGEVIKGLDARECVSVDPRECVDICNAILVSGEPLAAFETRVQNRIKALGLVGVAYQHRMFRIEHECDEAWRN